ncbi:glycosyltransferase [Mesorhizobium sp. B2-6-2]|uniref:rhamnosyltransferase WsaF family glycosyltransferase n=1 Tax=Mesorhizobium sp. B2-6-2 TaxID=2589915 RepID=UPI001128E318|nr:glycosyltransferase [Mesorhizobium sp. B2-6-2]TPJ77784.1 glycosyltransferase [Mesorhizobium sp. B2-6-2]
MNKHPAPEQLREASAQSADQAAPQKGAKAKSPKTKPAKRTCIMVLGMHRSGTSALTRAISLLGAELPKNLLGANPTNPTGHWEPSQLIELHDQMLEEAGSRWDDWRSFDLGNLPNARAQFYRAEIARLIDEEYGDASFLVLKEPRISRFVPLYASILKSMKIDVRYVLASRNPLAVIASLGKRDRSTPGFGALLWLRHELDAERSTRDSLRAFVSYEGIMQDWRLRLDRIAKALSVTWPRPVEQAAAEIDAHISQDHQHHAATDGALFADERVASWVKDAYSALRALEADPNDSEAMEVLDRIKSEFDAVAPVFGEAFFPELQARQQISTQAQSRLQKVASENARLAKERAAEIERLTIETTQMAAEIERLTIEAKQRVADWTEREVHWVKERDRLARDHAAAREREAALAGALELARTESDAARRESTLAVEELNTVRRQAQIIQFLADHRGLQLLQRRRSPAWLAAASVDLLTGLPNRMRFSRERALIVGSRLFDEEWYRQRNPDVATAGVDPASHYLRHGAYEGRDPSPFFDSLFYLTKYPDVAVAGVNPLVHFIRHGAREGRRIAPDRHGPDRQNRNPEKKASDMTAFREMTRFGLKVIDRARNAGKAEIERRVDHLLKFVDYESTPEPSTRKPTDFDRLKITWVIPDFQPGAGGHMTIFRIARYLEVFGHEVEILIQNPVHHSSGDDAKRTVNHHFQPFSGAINLFSSETPRLTGDALIATDRFTCYPVNAMSGFARKFYFVQDYETLFYPAGSEGLLTDATYTFDFDCLCAGEWLSGLMRERFGRWAVSWPLAYDRSVYKLDESVERSTNRVAFYARFATPRRAVELGMVALDILRERGVNFEVDFFGVDLGPIRRGYHCIDHGVLDAERLAQLYRRAAVGVVFSATNHSLVNKEMMGCGLPVVDLDVESTRAIFPADSMTFAKPTPVGIANAIQHLLERPAERHRMSRRGLDYVSDFSWEASARIVEAALKERIALAVTAEVA